MTTAFNEYTPRPFPLSRNQSIVAPYWADVDTTGTGRILYRQTYNSALLARATDEIRAAFPTSQNVNVTSLLIVTWDAVGYYDGHTDKV